MPEHPFAAIDGVRDVDSGDEFVIEDEVSEDDLAEHAARLRDSADAQAEALAGLHDLSAG
jgi:hypothetical protein